MAPRFREVQGEQYVPSVRFTVIGQKVSGVYVKRREREGRFGREAVADLRMDNGEIKAVVMSLDLVSKMAQVPPGSLVRITFDSELDVGQRSPMRIFKVEVADDEGGEPGPADDPF